VASCANQLWAVNVLLAYWHPYPHVVPVERDRVAIAQAFEHIRRTRRDFTLLGPAYRGGNVLLVTNLLVIQGLLFLLLGNMEQGRRVVIFFRFVPKVVRKESTPCPSFLIGYANAAVLTSLFANSSCNSSASTVSLSTQHQPDLRMCGYHQHLGTPISYVHQLFNQSWQLFSSRNLALL